MSKIMRAGLRHENGCRIQATMQMTWWYNFGKPRTQRLGSNTVHDQNSASAESLHTAEGFLCLPDIVAEDGNGCDCSLRFLSCCGRYPVCWCSLLHSSTTSACAHFSLPNPPGCSQLCQQGVGALLVCLHSTYAHHGHSLPSCVLRR